MKVLSIALLTACSIPWLGALAPTIIVDALENGLQQGHRGYQAQQGAPFNTTPHYGGVGSPDYHNYDAYGRPGVTPPPPPQDSGYGYDYGYGGYPDNQRQGQKVHEAPPEGYMPPPEYVAPTNQYRGF